jgi:hypothetical protein
MYLTLQRTKFTDDSTIGRMEVGDVIVTTLEDGKREHKIYGETAIPTGTYQLELRNEGGMSVRYNRRYPWHRGMIWLQDVPMFEWIYIHVGNYPRDTNGCILVGTTSGDDMIGSSRNAYKAIYSVIADAIDSEEGCRLRVKD